MSVKTGMTVKTAEKRQKRPIATVGELRAKLQRLAGGNPSGGRLILGMPPIDAALGGGLACGALHEVAAVDNSAAATGFAALLLARLSAASGKPVLWMPAGDLYAPGLLGFGLDPARLILADFRRPATLLRALEEALRCRGLAAVVGESEAVDLTASRRLQLAAEAGGVTGILLRRAPAREASVAVTRWQVWSATSLAERPRWRLSLIRCRGGRTGDWVLEGSHATGGFAVAAALVHRPAAPAA